MLDPPALRCSSPRRSADNAAAPATGPANAFSLLEILTQADHARRGADSVSTGAIRLLDELRLQFGGREGIK